MAQLTDIVARVGAELITRKVISNLSFVTPQQTDSPESVHALWPLANDAGHALYVRATPDGDHVSVYAQIAEYHAAQEQIVKGGRPHPPGADGFFHRTTVAYDGEAILKELVPIYEAAGAMQRPPQSRH